MALRARNAVAIGALTLASGGALAACFSAPVPMTYVRHDLPVSTSAAGATGAPARCLFVLLPGMGDDADDFRSKGVVETIRRSGLSADIVATNATFGYYMKGKMPEQLWVDVVRPTRASRQYDQTWLIGMSMGGLGTFLSAKDHASELTGIIALAPYLGRDNVLESVRKAGGLKFWNPPPIETPNSENYDAQLWRWLKAATHGETQAPEMYLGWGKADKLGESDSLLAASFPSDHVFQTEGGHDWGPWNTLLARILREGSVAQGCKATP